MIVPLFSIRGLSVALPGRRLLQDLSLDLPGGAMTALIGHNGSGKSTLLKVLARQVAPAAGTVLFEGRALPSAPCAARPVPCTACAPVLRHACCVPKSACCAARPASSIRVRHPPSCAAAWHRRAPAGPCPPGSRPLRLFAAARRAVGRVGRCRSDGRGLSRRATFPHKAESARRGPAPRPRRRPPPRHCRPRHARPARPRPERSSGRSGGTRLP